MSLRHKLRGIRLNRRDITFFVLDGLASENRRILSYWRAYLQLKKHEAPPTVASATKALKRLQSRNLIAPLVGTGKRILYQVTSPYAGKDVNIYELVSEAYYTGIFAFSSAFELHGLSDQRSRKLHLYLPPSLEGQILRITDASSPGLAIPLDSTPADWRLVELPPQLALSTFRDYNIKSHAIKPEWIFGFEVSGYDGVPIRRTDLERTLIDGLRFPKHCGGLNEVFRGWVRALERLSVDNLVDYTERLGQLILYQRMGFVMETLGLQHKALASWKKEKTPRGGSRLLDPGGKYAATYSEDWNLSINHPIEILQSRDASYS